MDLSLLDFIVATGAAFAAGVVNAVAGGGTLISFPALLAIGVPPVAANVTNTVALCPGYFGGAAAQRADLADRPARARLPRLGVAGAVGGLAGSVLLVLTSDDLFEAAVPFLILVACTLLAVQDPVRAWLRRRRGRRSEAAVPTGGGVATSTRVSPVLAGGVLVAAVYGGYFGAGLGIMLLAILGMLLDEPLNRLNALKSVLALVINVVAALFFVIAGDVEWRLAPLMAVASLGGGMLGGRLARRVSPGVLRVVVIVFGVAVAVRSWA